MNSIKTSIEIIIEFALHTKQGQFLVLSWCVKQKIIFLSEDYFVIRGKIMQYEIKTHQKTFKFYDFCLFFFHLIIKNNIFDIMTTFLTTRIQLVLDIR